MPIMESLSAGVGGIGIATAREMGAGRERVPRNAPDVWNRGHASFSSMFWDSRVVENPEDPTGYTSPAGADLPLGMTSALAVQALFPVTSGAEMRGDPGENEIADAAGNPAVWAALMDRLLAIDEYRDLFAAAYPGVAEAEMGFQHAAEAIAAFEAATWRADDAPFDRYLHGDDSAMSRAAKRGAFLFYGAADCGSCHAGALQSDLEHHAIASPQVGPGKGDGPDGDEDLGRGRETSNAADDYAFRTPSLRNVALNAPYLHAGAYTRLEDAVRHHLDPVASLEGYDATSARLAPGPDVYDDWSVMEDAAKRARIADANALAPASLTDAQLEDLLAFLHALTDPASIDIRNDVPTRVPSGLPLFD
jgi:cytochrome c peroxidase